MSGKSISYTSGDNESGKLPFLHRPSFAVGFLIMGLLLTIGAWYLSNYYLHQQADSRFKYRSEEIKELISIRMQLYEQAIRGGVALFNSSDFVSREAWRAYTNTLNLQNSYPGIQAFGFSYYIPEGQVDSLERQVHQEGFDDFKVHPISPQTEDHAIIYIEPFEWRNKRAFGYNMYSEEDRRAAMSRARDNATAALSKKTILIQETDEDVQFGFLLYVPVFKGDSLGTIEERRKNLYGFVYGAFRIEDLMQQILTRSPRDVEFTIYDGDTTDPEDLLFNSSNDPALSSRNEFSSIDEIVVAGHTWTIVFNANDLFLSRSDYLQPLLIALAGIVVELILFYLIWTAYSINKHNQQLKTNAENIANRLRIAVSAANMGTWELNLRNQTSVRSLEHDKIFGYSELQPKWDYKIFIGHVLPKHRAIVENAFNHSFKTGKLKFECQLDPEKVKPERWIYVEGETTFNLFNKPVRMNGIVMDISERKKAEQAVRESEERFKYIADASPVMIWMTNQKGQLTYYNKTMKDFIGLGDEDLKANEWEPVVHPDDASDVKNKFFISIKERKHFEAEYRIRRNDGNYVWFMASGIPRYTSGGDFIGYVGSSFNIHDRKLAEESLKQKQQMLESSNEDLNTFIYTVSHDIKNPLTALLLHSQLAEDYTTIEEYQEFMGMVKRKSEKIQEIIDVMSNVIREENRDKTVENIDLNQEIREVLEDFEEIAKEINATIRYNLEISEIRYIRGYIRSILQNLVGNAIKYRDKERPLNIEITISKSGGFILLTVKDNGIGIDLTKESQKLFKPFHRITSNHSGSGLGLFIIKRMVQKNGGNIKVESEPGKGTTFFCLLHEYEVV